MKHRALLRLRAMGAHVFSGESLCDIQIHEDKVANAASHNKQVKYFMGAEVFVFGVE